MDRRWIAVLGAVMLGSCGMSPEEEACNDTVDALVDLFSRCQGQSAADSAREFYMSIFKDCHVEAIRDEVELREKCIPALGKVQCDAVTDTNDWLPSSCKSQLLF